MHIELARYLAQPSNLQNLDRGLNRHLPVSTEKIPELLRRVTDGRRGHDNEPTGGDDMGC